MADTAHDPHSSFIRTPKQLIVVILLAFVIPVVGIIMLVQLITAVPTADQAALAPERVAQRLQPVARIEFGPPQPPAVAAATPAPGAPAAPVPIPPPVAAAPGAAPVPAAAGGKAIYDKSCAACHAVSVAGSPALGNKAAWEPRIKQGLDALVQSALKGKGAMPPKGGNPALSEAEVRSAVEFMVSQSK